MRTIYDYKDLRKLEQSELAEELISGIIVTATASLAAELRSYYPGYIVIGMHDLIKEIIPEWDESTKALINYISLRNSLDNYAAENEIDKTVFLSMERSAVDIWNAILLLVEADVYPHDIPDSTSGPIHHFREIWKQLEVENSTLMNMRAQFAFRLSNEDIIVSCVESCIKRTYNELAIDVKKKRLFFLGFYFITPIQARLIDVLSHANFDIAYLNCHDSRYHYACEIWERTFKEEYEKGHSIDIQPDISFYNGFGEILNGNADPLELSITKYSSNLDFAQAIKTPLQNGASVFTPELKTCQKILKEYYPEYSERKHLLAYPVGQYIYYLHKMWNSVDSCLELQYENIYKCFSTGWLEVDHINGRDHIYDLARLEPLFERCDTLDMLHERFRNLISAKDKLQKNKTKEGPNERWHKLMGDPFRHLSITSLPEKTIEELEVLIDKLMEDANYLFSSSGKIRISDHFSKISMMIQKHLDRDDVLEDEVQIAEELIKSLELASAQDQECPMSAIKDAIVLLIGGRFDEVDTLDREISSIEERVKPLSMVESSLLSNYGEDIHLVLADEFTLPGKQRDFPWPLTDTLLKSLDIDDREDTKRYVSHMRSVIENRPLSYRYLFFSFISNVNEDNHPTLHISWINNQGKKTVSPSPYLMIMRNDLDKLKNAFSAADYEKEISTVDLDDLDLDINAPPDEAPIIVSMDYRLCKYRYFYSYLINYLPEYKNTFHYPFLLTNLIKYYSNKTGESIENTSKELFKCFSFFRRVERQQALDYVGKGEIRGEDLLFDDVEYSSGILDIHFLVAKDKALRKYQGRTINENQDEICMYCPYTDVCIFKSDMVEDE